MYAIKVKTIEGNRLVFKVKSYIIEHGFVIFKDMKKGEIKRFHGSNCEIEEVRNLE